MKRKTKSKDLWIYKHLIKFKENEDIDAKAIAEKFGIPLRKVVAHIGQAKRFPKRKKNQSLLKPKKPRQLKKTILLLKQLRAKLVWNSGYRLWLLKTEYH